MTTISKIKTKNKKKLLILEELTRNSKDLYNKSLYITRQYFFNNKQFLKYNELYKKIKNEPEYTRLPTNASQQTIKSVSNNFFSFFKLLEKKKSGKYNKKVNIPGYLDKNGKYKVIFTRIHFKIISNIVRLTLPKYIKDKYEIRFLYFTLPKNINWNNLKEVHILPYNKNQYKLAFMYQVQEKEIPNIKELTDSNFLSIDLGIDNLCSIFLEDKEPEIIDGKVLKSRNCYFNKEIAVLSSKLTKNKKPNELKKILNNKKLLWLYEKRNNYVKNYLHKVSNYIIRLALKYNKKFIIIGRNKGWKNKVNLGKKNNKNFLQIPHTRLIEYIKYKSILNGIKVIEINESYTSKIDALANEPVKKQDKYLGKRINRGTFLSSLGKIINADINAAINIARKFFNKLSISCESLITRIIGNGLVYRPVRVYIS